jgi:glutamate:GABA antiporter
VTISQAPDSQGHSAAWLVAREKAKLRKSFFRTDLVLFTACAIVALETLAFTASAGGEAFTWLVVTFLLFFIPYGLVSAELGAAFPAEGGPYEWVRMSFGRLAGSVTAVLYWISNPIWMGGSLTAVAIAAIDSFILHRQMGTTAEIIFGLVFVWAVVGTAIIAVKYGKWVTNVGMIVKILLTVAFLVLTIAFLVSHGRPSGTVGTSDLRPTISGFLFLVGVLMFNWLGFELSTGASEEMVNPQKDIPKMIARSGAISAAIYGVFLVCILLVIPKAALTKVAGFTDAYSHVATVLGSAGPWIGKIIAVLVVAGLLVSGTAWIMGADRVQAVAALDGAAPAWMGKFTSFGTPIAVNIMSGLVGTAMVIMVFMFTSGKLGSFFAVMLPLAISTFALSYIFIFPALLRLRRKYPDVTRPYRVPGGSAGAWISVVLIEAFTIITGITLLWPGLIDAMLGQQYSIEASFSVSRTFFESVTLGTFGVVLVLGIVFWATGERDRRKGVTGEPELVLGAAAAAPSLAGADPPAGTGASG